MDIKRVITTASCVAINAVRACPKSFRTKAQRDKFFDAFESDDRIIKSLGPAVRLVRAEVELYVHFTQKWEINSNPPPMQLKDVEKAGLMTNLFDAATEQNGTSVSVQGVPTDVFALFNPLAVGESGGYDDSKVRKVTDYILKTIESSHARQTTATEPPIDLVVVAPLFVSAVLFMTGVTAVVKTAYALMAEVNKLADRVNEFMAKLKEHEEQL